MAKAKKGRRRRKQRFETTDVLAWGPSRTRRRPAASRVMWLRLRGLLLVTLIAVAAAGVWMGLDDRFYIQHADVTGAVRVSPGEVFRASGLPGLHILWARPSKTEKRILEALPTLESVRVKCTLPARCEISVIERQPKVIWEENGVVWWIDADGMIFQPPMVLSSGAGDTLGEAQRWVVRGPLPRDEEGHLDDRVCVGLSELWATGADVALAYEYVPGRGLMFTDERGWPVFLGQGPGMAKRLNVLERLTADLEMGGLTPLFVDVRFPDTPYYSLTNNWWD